jgi:hypothetical protein
MVVEFDSGGKSMAETHFVFFFYGLAWFIDNCWQHHLMLCNFWHHVRSLS